MQVGLLLSWGHPQQREGCGRVRSGELDGDVRGMGCERRRNGGDLLLCFLMKLEEKKRKNLDLSFLNPKNSSL